MIIFTHFKSLSIGLTPRSEYKVKGEFETSGSLDEMCENDSTCSIVSSYSRNARTSGELNKNHVISI